MPSPRPVKPSFSVVVADRIGLNTGDFGDHFTHRVLVWADFWRFADDREVEIADPVACLAGETDCVGQKLAGSRAFPAFVAGREVGADVAEPGCRQERVDDRMSHRVSV